MVVPVTDRHLMQFDPALGATGRQGAAFFGLHVVHHGEATFSAATARVIGLAISARGSAR